MKLIAFLIVLIFSYSSIHVFCSIVLDKEKTKCIRSKI